MNCSFCLSELENSLVTKIECGHTFCIKCSSVFCGVLKDVCPKCGGTVKKSTIYFYRKNDIPLWKVTRSEWNDMV